MGKCFHLPGVSFPWDQQWAGGGKCTPWEHSHIRNSTCSLCSLQLWNHTPAVHTTDLLREQWTPTYILAQFLPQTEVRKAMYALGFCPNQGLELWIKSEYLLVTKICYMTFKKTNKTPKQTNKPFLFISMKKLLQQSQGAGTKTNGIEPFIFPSPSCLAFFAYFNSQTPHSRKQMFYSCRDTSGISAITWENLGSAHYHGKHIMQHYVFIRWTTVKVTAIMKLWTPSTRNRVLLP